LEENKTISYCKKKIKEAEEKGDLKEIKNYTELLKVWEQKKGD
jgi:hypothetical protein